MQLLRLNCWSWTRTSGDLKVAVALAYCIGALVWSAPEGFPFQRAINRAYKPIFEWTGFWQGWAMFAPEPRSEDIYVEAAVADTAGNLRRLNISRMATMGYWERYRKERWRKFANEHLRLDQNSELWPAFARWLARSSEAESGVPIESVALTRSWRTVQIPTETTAEPWQHHQWYTWTRATEGPP